MELQNIVVRYDVKEQGVPDVGELIARVEISREAIFGQKSIDIEYVSSDNLSLGPNSISYRSIKADAYRGRIRANLMLPSDCLRNRTTPYSSARTALITLLPKIIAMYEKNYRL